MIIENDKEERRQKILDRLQNKQLNQEEKIKKWRKEQLATLQTIKQEPLYEKIQQNFQKKNEEEQIKIN